MAMQLGGARTLQAEPNVTPLIDVLLVLLILFMVIVPVTPRGLVAMIPQPPKAHEPAAPQTIVVQVLAFPAGAVYRINGQGIDGKARLAAELNRIFSVRAEKVLFVQGDRGVDFASVADVLDISHAVGIDHVGLLTPGVAAR